MGLDMYAYTTLKEVADKYPDVNPEFTEAERTTMGRGFAYWRKFNNLHGWMEDLYRSKGGTGEFNCDFIRLKPEDIDSLEKAAQEMSLKPVAGFFFGTQDEFNEEDKQEVLDFCKKCRTAFDDGFAVYYSSWW